MIPQYPKKLVHLTLPAAVYTRLKKLADATDRTVPGYLRWLVNRHFWELDRENKKQSPDLHLPEDGELF